MKMTYVYYMLALGCLGAFIFYATSRHASSSANSVRVAIIQPVSHPSLDEIVEGFATTLSADIPDAHIDYYNANGNPTLMKSQVDDILRRHYNLICTVATSPTVMMTNAARKQQDMTPIVFAAAEPAADIKNSGHITGTTDIINFKDEVNALLRIKPNIKHVMLVYNASIKEGQIEREKNELEQLLKNHGIRLSDVAVYTSHEVPTHTASAIGKDRPDVIMVLMDNTVVSAIDSLVLLCNRHGITLYASDHSSGAKGAALSFGHIQRMYGSEAARKAITILTTGVQAHTIPITVIDKQTLHINPTTAHQQGIELTDALRAHFKDHGTYLEEIHHD